MDGVFCTQYSVVWTPSQAASLAQPTSFVCHWTSDPVQTRPRPEKETDSPGSLPCAWGAEYSYIVSTQVAPVPAPQHVVIRDPPEFKFKPWRGSSESKRSKARLSQQQQAFPQELQELQERAPATSTSAQPHPSSPASSCTRQRQNRARRFNPASTPQRKEHKNDQNSRGSGGLPRRPPRCARAAQERRQGPQGHSRHQGVCRCGR